MLGSRGKSTYQALLLHKPVIYRFPRLVWTYQLDIKTPIHLGQNLVHLDEGDVFADAASSASSEVEVQDVLSGLQLFFRSLDPARWLK